MHSPSKRRRITGLEKLRLVFFPVLLLSFPGIELLYCDGFYASQRTFMTPISQRQATPPSHTSYRLFAKHPIKQKEGGVAMKKNDTPNNKKDVKSHAMKTPKSTTSFSRRDLFLKGGTILTSLIAISTTTSTAVSSDIGQANKAKANPISFSVPVPPETKQRIGPPTAMPTRTPNSPPPAISSPSLSAPIPSKQITTTPKQLITPHTTTTTTPKLQPINLTKVTAENTINVTLIDPESQSELTVNRTSFTKVQTPTRKYPFWIPPLFTPQRGVVVKEIPNSELLLAGIVAGSVTEIVRTGLLYPLSTVKTRIQANATTTTSSSSTAKNATISSKLTNLYESFIYSTTQGNLYAGLLPSLLITVPSSGVYCGIRDVTMRLLVQYASITPTHLDDVVIKLTGALVADVVSVGIRTPAEALSLRLQVWSGQRNKAREKKREERQEEERRNMREVLEMEDHHHEGEGGGIYFVKEEVHEEFYFADAVVDVIKQEQEEEDDRKIQIGDWYRDGIASIPAVIVTDLPYLLLRITLNYYSIKAISSVGDSGSISLGRYELITIIIACGCAALTTPFDVARTRILVDSDGDASNGLDGGSREGVWSTMKQVMREGEIDTDGSDREGQAMGKTGGGVQNLYAGWLERTAYFGIGRAWLDPIRVIGYLGIRDTVLLQWFQ